MSNRISVIQKSLKIRLYPSPNQALILNKTFGCCRLVYNERLVEHKNWYDLNKDKPKEDRYKFKGLLPKELRETKYPFLGEDTISKALINALQNCETAYSNWYKSLSGKRKKIGSPKFKRKSDHRDSFSLYQLPKDCFDFHNRKIKISKIGLTKFRCDKNLSKWYLEAIPKHITISRNPANEYWCSILFEKQEDIYQNISLKNTTGLDFSPNSLYINDLNEECKNYIPQKQAHKKKLAHLERLLSRKKKGSNNREKARVKLARLEQHISDSRKDFIEKETLRLVRNYGLIGIEDLNLVGLIKYSKNAKNYVDTSWSTFVNKLIWKSRFNNCFIIKSDRFYPSSKTCSHCGYVNKNLTLKDRVWICPDCGETIIRDQNAAINLKENAIKILSESLNQILGWGSSEVMSMEDIEVNVFNGNIYGVSGEVEKQNREIC